MDKLHTKACKGNLQIMSPSNSPGSFPSLFSGLDDISAGHQSANHSKKKWVRTAHDRNITTNPVEVVQGVLKRTTRPLHLFTGRSGMKNIVNIAFSGSAGPFACDVDSDDE